jgi:hypothetical protein
VERTPGAFDHRFDILTGVAYALRRHGVRPILHNSQQLFGAWYAPGGTPAQSLVRVACRPGPGGVIGRVPERGPCPVVVMLTSR